MGIGNRKQFGHAPPGPLLLGTSLAVGAVTIATGVIDIVAMTARIAFQAMTAQGGSPAIEHSSNRLGLRSGQAVCIKILGSEGLKHLRQPVLSPVEARMDMVSDYCCLGSAASRSRGFEVTGGRHRQDTRWR